MENVLQLSVNIKRCFAMDIESIYQVDDV